jgi:hypothetical protein
MISKKSLETSATRISHRVSTTTSVGEEQTCFERLILASQMGTRCGAVQYCKSNLFGYGMHAPGSNAANAIPVHSQQEEDSSPAGRG